MNVLILSQYFWPENFRINEIAKTLLEKGIAVEVLTGKPNYPKGKFFSGYRARGCQKENYQGININRIPLLARKQGGLCLALNYLSFILSGVVFGAWMLRRKKYDVIFVYAPSPILQAIPAIFIGWLKKCPVVLSVQDLWPESLSATGYVANCAVLKLVEYVVRFIYQHVDLLLVQSMAFESPVRALALKTPIAYYPNSVDDAFATPMTVETPYVSGFDDAFSILFAGNIGTAQAVSVIVDAALLLKDYTDIHFVVLGEGSLRDWMLEELQHHNLANLHVPGQFPLETMPGFMQKASALLVTLRNQPIFAATVPSKIQAYLAAGRPIIACLNGEGARLVIEAKAGLTSPAEDAQALADTILHLYHLSPHEREKMGANGRKYYQKHFTHEDLVNQLINHLQIVCHKKEMK